MSARGGGLKMLVFVQEEKWRKQMFEEKTKKKFIMFVKGVGLKALTYKSAKNVGFFGRLP